MHRFTRALGLLGVGAALALTLTPLPNVLARALATQAAAGPADAVVVLASTVRPDGTLTGESLRRALHGILLYRRGRAPLLLMSGVADPRGGNEADVRARLARDLGVPPAS